MHYARPSNRQHLVHGHPRPLRPETERLPTDRAELLYVRRSNEISDLQRASVNEDALYLSFPIF